MSLSSELVAQFVEVTNDNTEIKRETTVYGIVKVVDGKQYVQLDGSDILTPINTTVDIHEKDRVIVMIKNHSAIVTGNVNENAITRKSALIQPSGDFEMMDDPLTISGINDKITELDNLIADRVDTKAFTAEIAKIEKLQVDVLEVIGDIGDLEVGKLNVEYADIIDATIEDLNATNATVNSLTADHGEFKELTTDNFEAVNAKLDNLDAEHLNATYANIDFSNITKAAMEYLYSTSGLIDNVVIGDGTITGRLVGVTISGDVIEGNTVVAEKLVIKGEDGLYYKLNTDGVTTEAEQTEYNSLNGNVILAKSVTAEKINVNDLVAFDATIGGFTITENSIFSEVKDSEDNTTRGIYMNTDGQINFGDSSNFIKYYKDEDGTYKLAISAASILYALGDKQYSIADLGQIGDYVHITTYEGEPCIELGEVDSDFRLIITNTRIMFMEGSTTPAYINNQSLHITKAVIEEEIQQGEFVWKVRQNGNMGLMWKGEA